MRTSRKKEEVPADHIGFCPRRFLSVLGLPESPVHADRSHSGIVGCQHVHIAVSDKDCFVGDTVEMPGRVEGSGGIGLWAGSA